MDHISLCAHSTREAEHWQSLGVLQDREGLAAGVSSHWLKLNQCLSKWPQWSLSSRLESLHFSKHESGLVLHTCLPSRKQKHLWEILLPSDIMWNISPRGLAVKEVKLICLLFSMYLVYPTTEIVLNYKWSIKNRFLIILHQCPDCGYYTVF